MPNNNIRVLLLINPEEALLDAHDAYLTTHGFIVKTASDGTTGLSIQSEWQPDVIVIEPDMPDGGAQQILSHLPQSPPRQRVPVIILSRLNPSTFADPVCEYHVKATSLAVIARSILIAAHTTGIAGQSE